MRFTRCATKMKSTLRGLVGTDMKPCDKSKEQVRTRRLRNLVAKNNTHKGGYHSSKKYVRRKYTQGDLSYEFV